jgi:hypothetical protein
MDKKPQAKKPIYALIDTVSAAIREYDRSNDHIPHGEPSDCIRCNLIKALPWFAPV